MAYENFAIAYKVLKENPDSSFYWLKKNERLLAKTDESRTFSRKITLYTLYGNHYRDKQEYDTAISYYNKALSLITEYHFPYSSWLDANWGDLYMQRGDADSALIYYQKGLENLKITNLKNELVELYYRIADIYSHAGAEDSAKFYWEKYLQVDNEIKESKNKATEKAFQILLENEQDYTWKKYQQAFLIAGGILILLVLIMIISYELLTKRKNKMLNSKENEISEYMFITHRSVQTSKSRLRKKLGIHGETDLYQYIKSFSN